MTLVPKWMTLCFLGPWEAFLYNSPLIRHLQLALGLKAMNLVDHGLKPWDLYYSDENEINALPFEKFLLWLPWELSKTPSRRVAEDIHRIARGSWTKLSIQKACLHNSGWVTDINILSQKASGGLITMFA